MDLLIFFYETSFNMYFKICFLPVACDFESDFCEWKAENWALQIAGNIPATDHTTNTNTGKNSLSFGQYCLIMAMLYQHSLFTF